MHRLVALTLILSGPAFCLAQKLEHVGEPCPGYTLIAPLGSRDSHLINMEGEVVHTWPSPYQPGNSTYLLPDGGILRSCKHQNNDFNARGGAGGGVCKVNWDGEVVWDFKYSTDTVYQHHDIEPMPNGNVLLVAWEYKSYDEAIAAGRDPSKLQDELWPESVVEIQPEGKTGGKVVWKWSLWDHVVQRFNKTKANYGKPADHPELVDLNFIRNANSDWIHMNSVAYNQELDQIIMSARWFNELWIIDHSTTTEEAAGHTGGRYGKGGDLLYRWGNPYAYFAGFPEDQIFFGQHDARWIPKSYPGGGNITVYNNGGERTGRNWSSADELKPSIKPDGSYELPAIDPYGPKQLLWSYSEPDNFLSERISGAERQPNGNTLICCGDQGWVFEVTPDKKIVWEFRASSLPNGGRGGAQGGPGGGSPRGGGRAGGPGGGRGGSPGLFRAPRYPLDFAAFKGRSLE